ALVEEMVGRVSAHHARALSLYSEELLTSVIEILKAAGVSVVSNPHTGPLHAPVKKLLRNGVNVALGQDDIADAYYPFGRCKMLEIAFLASHLMRMMTKNDLETMMDMITCNAARAMALSEYGVKPGSYADFVIHDAASVYEAIWHQAEPLYVIRKGKIILERQQTTKLNLAL
ncbi:MAG: amidohydrolase family protein, partial [Candidatus Caldarchaeum sp.]|nr:amidohydrolase family protein [Candidatus Caldarchaeum sp.]